MPQESSTTRAQGRLRVDNRRESHNGGYEVELRPVQDESIPEQQRLFWGAARSGGGSNTEPITMQVSNPSLSDLFRPGEEIVLECRRASQERGRRD